MEAQRKFDITWLKRSSGASSAANSPLLEPFRVRPDQSLRVVDIAKDSGVEFDGVLRGVLQLVSTGELEIVKRDEKADDHLVRLTLRGRQSLPPE